MAATYIWRQLLYANSFHTAWWYDINKPENFGFRPGQVTPFTIRSADGVELYAWHIQSEAAEALSRDAKESSRRALTVEEFKKTVAFERLQRPDTKLILYFHGNAGDVTQSFRIPCYKSLISHNQPNTHVITFDYRGFGLSRGSPNEQGLIQDGIAVVDWALKEASIPPERVVLFGHSLGTGVLIGVADYFISRDCQIKFAGIVLVSPFSSVSDLVLARLSIIPGARKFFESRFVDEWNSKSRLQHLTSLSKNLRLSILHARNDLEIPSKHSEILWLAALEGAGFDGADADINELMDGGNVSKSWRTTGGKNIYITKSILMDGGHNKIIADIPLALTIREIFEL